MQYYWLRRNANSLNRTQGMPFKNKKDSCYRASVFNL